MASLPRIARSVGLWFAVCATAIGATSAAADTLEEAFRNPPPEARPWVFWYWVRGAVSRDGITADLAAMKQAGLAGAYLFCVNPPAAPPDYTPAAIPLTPEWWTLVKHAAAEADRHALGLAFPISDGFATAGGPWITPELAMQKVVWSTTTLSGGAPATVRLAQPPTNEGYYRDIAVLAYPAPPGDDVSTRSVPVRVTTSLPGVEAQFLAAGGEGERQVRADGPCWIQYAFEQPFTLRSLVLRQWDRNYAGIYHATRLRIQASDDGRAFRDVTRLEPPRHGWQDWDADYTFAVPAVTARVFRFVHDPAGAESGGEELNGAKWKPRLTLRGLVLSSAPRITGFEGKSGAVWRRSAAATSAELSPGSCVPLERIVDLTAHMNDAGELTWTPPAGRWTVLRMGYTPTGHRNETATGAGGLECDKMNPAAARLQFDRWFGEIMRQLGPDLARRVVKIFHVDSWEAGSQNWTPAFRSEFNRRRGYDPLQHLPAMAGVPVGSAGEAERFLRDVRQTIAELVTQNFFGTLHALAKAQGVAFSAEATAPTMVGDGMAPFAEVDLPMGEFWLRSPTHDKPNDIADAVSGAHVYGHRIVQAEAFTELRSQWDEHPGMLKPLGDRMFALGVNRLVPHVFVHNPWLDRRPGMTLSGLGLYFQRDQTWWPQARAWVDYLSRCQALLQYGRPAADVAYFTGDELPRRALLADRFKPALPRGYAADSINPDALVRLATLRDGRVELPGGASYAAVVVPAGAAPMSEPGKAKWRELAPAIAGTDVPLATWLERAGVPPDFLVDEADGQPAESMAWIHRTGAEAEVYFVSNQLDRVRRVTVSLRAPRTTGAVELWEPVSGLITTAGAVVQGGRVRAPLDLEPNGSGFVVLRRASAASRSAVVRRQSPAFAPIVAVGGPWTVSFASEVGGPREAQVFRELVDWTQHRDPDVRYYSGTAVYRTEFLMEGARGEGTPPPVTGAGRVWIALGRVGNLAQVIVNGRDCGVAWTAPFRLNISDALRPGVNQLEVRVTNTWANRLIGDRLTGARHTWTTAPARPDAALLPAGLLGPVEIVEER